MSAVIAFILANPALVGIVLGLIESVVMPIVPVKWNGLFNTIFSFLRSKYVKAKVEAEVKVEKSEAVKKMEKAVEENLKASAEDKLGE